MRKFYFFIVIISLFMVSGCSKDDNPVTPSTRGTISGKITDQTSGNVISGASISTQPATTTVTSDNVGNYTISDVEAGSYSLTVTMSGYVSNTSNVNVTAGQTSALNISLSPTPIPDPVASFNYGGSMVTPAVITFQNTSQNADIYLWDFGDNTTSTETNPTKSYNQMGTYTVKLTASNSVTSNSNQTSQNLTITPGKVFLQSVIVDDIPFIDPSTGGGWDLNSGPDVYFTIIDSARNVYATSSYYSDVVLADLPLQWNFNPELEFTNWGRTYFIDLWDYDTATNDDEIGFTTGFRIIDVVNANYPTTVSLQSSDGEIKVRLILRWQ